MERQQICFTLSGSILPFLIGIVTMIFFTPLTIAQDISAQDTSMTDTSIKTIKDHRGKLKVGVRLSAVGGLIELLNGASPRSIQEPKDDTVPYPFVFFSVYYKNYEAIVGFADDFYHPTYAFQHNENIFILSIRYNTYVKNMYGFGGLNFFNLNKKFTFTKYVCNEYEDSDQNFRLSGPPCKEGASEIVNIETGRPDGKSLFVGGVLGLGVRYEIFDVFVLSHALEMYFTPTSNFCPNQDTVCFGYDLKFMGVHLKL